MPVPVTCTVAARPVQARVPVHVTRSAAVAELVDATTLPPSTTSWPFRLLGRTTTVSAAVNVTALLAPVTRP